MTRIFETSDAPYSTVTPYSMAPGDYFFGSLTYGDQDIVSITLQAGQTYTISMVGTGALNTGVYDTYLKIWDPTGTYVSYQDDNGGPGLNSSITFTAYASGTYYIDPTSTSYYLSDTGTYGISVTLGDKASYDVVMGAAALLRFDASWSATAGTPVTVTWGIRSGGFATDASGYPVAFEALTSSQVATVSAIMSMIEGICGVDLVQVNAGGTTQSATILVGGYTSSTDGAGAYAIYPGSTLSSDRAGDVWLNNNSFNYSGGQFGSWAYYAIMHEMGHALGLAHPGDYNASSGSVITYDLNAQFTEDSHQYTVMSYFDESNTGAYTGYSYPDTFLLFDFYALHQLYGADRTYHSGNSVYGFNSNMGGPFDFNVNTDPFLCIWDGGGADTLDLSGYAMSQVIDLRSGMFSDIGGYLKNLSIAIGAVIENAVGGSGADLITGNGAANRIWGGGGNDSLLGGGGNDTLNGGSGADVLDGGSGRDYASYASASVGVLADMLVTSVSTGEAVGDSFNGVEGLVGSALRDELRGDNLQNFLFAGASNDVLGGRGGNDHLYGEGGNDLLVGGAGADYLNGGGGRDYALYGQSTFGLVIDMVNPGASTGEAAGDVFALLEGIAGTNFADDIRGTSEQNFFFGRGGSDMLSGGGGDDHLYGDGGADVVRGESGNDILVGGGGADSFVFDSGADRVLDFVDNIDTLIFEDALWGGGLSVAQVISTYASVVASDTVFNFGGGNTLTLLGFANLAALNDDLAFV